MKSITLIVALLAFGLILSTSAYAQSSVDGSPGNDQGGQIQSTVGQGGGGGGGGGDETSPVSTSDEGGSLPFTGLDLALLAAAGGLLVAAGFGMRRLTRAPSTAA